MRTGIAVFGVLAALGPAAASSAQGANAYNPIMVVYDLGGQFITRGEGFPTSKSGCLEMQAAQIAKIATDPGAVKIAPNVVKSASNNRVFRALCISYSDYQRMDDIGEFVKGGDQATLAHDTFIYVPKR